MSRVLLIIPAFNEEESLPTVIEEIRNYNIPNLDFVVINDGSKDQTVNVCRQLKVNYIDLPINLGLTGAFETGMIYAREHDYDIAIQFDADGQHRIESITNIIKQMEEKHADVIIGSRFLNDKKSLTLRMLGSNLIGMAIKLTTGVTLTDPTSGLRAFNKRMINLYLNTGNMTPEPDTVSYLLKSGANIEEIQIQMRDRLAGESYLTFSRSMKYMLRMSISILILQLFRKNLKVQEWNHVVND